MGSGGSDIPRVDEIGGTKAIDHTIRNSAGALVGRLRLYESGTPDGVVCTQLELRLENHKASPACSGREGRAVCAMRGGRGYPGCGDRSLCQLVADRPGRELENG